MTDYSAFHFSPANDRNLLMPRHDKSAPFQRVPMRFGKRGGFVKDAVCRKNPYAPVNLGFFPKEEEIGGIARRYAVYVPATMTSKGKAILLFLPSGQSARAALDSGWQAVSDKHGMALLLLENEKWDKYDLNPAFDFAQAVLEKQFQRREVTDICEATIYPYGEGDAAAIALSYALTYSATFPAFAADGDCAVDPQLLNVLRALPSDGVDGLKKSAIPLPGLLIDRAGTAQAEADYIKETLCAQEENLHNDLARVYLQKAYRGQHFINEQPVGELWHADADTLGGAEQNAVREAAARFLARFSRWGGYGNAHLRRTRSPEQIGVTRVWKEIDGYKRFWDVYVPSYYQKEEARKYPLVVAIHGFSCNASYFEQTSDWDRVAEERGFIVAFASAYPQKGGLSQGFALPAWDTAGNGGIDEIPYFNALLDDTIASYPIDTERVYAVGHSNGGMTTFMLMDKLPTRFAAFGPTGSLLNMVDKPDFLTHGVLCPVYNMVGEYDLFGAELNTPQDGAWQSVQKLCAVNKAAFNNENWYDNGRYHTLVLYDAQHRPVVRYTNMIGCPHTYTAGMAELTWDDFLCHYARKADGSIVYKG